jgi:hypothetical protein
MVKTSAMAKAKKKKSEDFEAILAGFAERAAQELPIDEERSPEPQAQGVAESGTPSAGKPARRYCKNISFPWPTNISSLLGSFRMRLQNAYEEIAAEARQPLRANPPERESPQAAKVYPHKSEKTEDERIAEELGLTPELRTIDLKRIRRDFAKRNHPDRFGPANRSTAERRMSIANMLIDELMRQSRPPR